MTKVVFIGHSNFSLKTLRVIEEDKRFSIEGVCCSKQKSFQSDYSDLSAFCKEKGLDFIFVDDINNESSVAWIKEREPKVIFCLGWSRLVKEEVLSLPEIGVVGYHPALIPKNRGRHPLIWAICLGLRETGSSFFLMDNGADSGDLISQERMPIEANETATTLYEKMEDIALVQLRGILEDIHNGELKRSPQDHADASYWRKRSKRDGQIDWRMSAQVIDRLIRALCPPYPGAHFVYKGQDYIVLESQVSDDELENVEPGKVLDVCDDGIVIKCGVGSITLKIEPPEGLKRGDYL